MEKNFKLVVYFGKKSCMLFQAKAGNCRLRILQLNFNLISALELEVDGIHSHSLALPWLGKK